MPKPPEGCLSLSLPCQPGHLCILANAGLTLERAAQQPPHLLRGTVGFQRVTELPPSSLLIPPWAEVTDRISFLLPLLNQFHSLSGEEPLLMLSCVDTDALRTPRSLFSLPGLPLPPPLLPPPQGKGSPWNPRARLAVWPWGSRLPSLSHSFHMVR